VVERFERGWQLSAALSTASPLLRLWFRPRVFGLEQVPTDRPVVYVAKHPRTFLYLETVLLGLITFWEGEHRPFRTMEKRNTSIHSAPGLGWFRRQVQSIEATEEAALSTLALGESVLVYPGGSRDLYGPPDTVDWRGRRGFARFAARAGVPVVPVAMAGADRQHPWRLPLGRSRSLWLPLLPLPVSIDFWFGAPIAPPAASDGAGIARLAADAEAEVRALLVRAAGRRRAPPESRTEQAGST